MDPKQCFLSMIVVESLPCKMEWGLAQVFASSAPLAIAAVESEVYEMLNEVCEGNCCRFF